MTEAANAQTGEGTTAAAPETGATTTEATTTVPATGTSPPPAEGADKARTTIAGSRGAEDKSVAVAPADWPEDWRDKFAESIKPGDKKFRERLDRFTAPTEIGKSWLAAESKIGTGDAKKAPPLEGATADEIIAYKKEAGLPVEASEYIAKMELPKGVVFGEAEKPLVNSFAEAALANHWEPSTYNQALKWWTDEQVKQAAAREAADDQFHQSSDDTLRAEWGNDYRKNVNAIGNILATLPDEMHVRDGEKLEVGGQLLAARLPNGRLLGDHPAFVKWLAAHARELNPVATLLPAGSGDAKTTIDTEIGDIEKLMKDKSSDYWRGPKSTQIQQRYRDLLDGRERMTKGRAA